MMSNVSTKYIGEKYLNFSQLVFRLIPPDKYLAGQREKRSRASVHLTYGVGTFQ